MTRDKVIGVEEAVDVILDGDTVATGGFVGIGIAEHVLSGLERRFLESGHPRDLTLIFAAGQGDGGSRGLNHLAHVGLIKRAIGGHWGLVPGMGRLAVDGDIEAYCLPQGMISHWFREIAGGRPGVLSDVGIDTFVDPRREGGRLNDRTVANLLEVVEIQGKEHLFLPRMPIDVALIRGTTADAAGNISMEREAVTLEVLSIAQAAKNSGGLVIAQVERTTTGHSLRPSEVKIPGILVDAVVVSPPAEHPQTFAEAYNPAYTGEITLAADSIPRLSTGPRKVIARRAAMFLKPNAVVNLGIGIPEGVASVANEENVLDLITLTVEAGGIGGIPAGGLSFGASANAEATIDQTYQFDFYDGGGLHQAFLGLAQVDRHGNVNVSKYSDRVPGAGGFINISQNTRDLYFLGLFRAQAQLEVTASGLAIRKEGVGSKFVADVEQVTFSGPRAVARGQQVHFVTERCVMTVTDAGIEIIEIAPGLDLQRDVLDAMDFEPRVSTDLRLMDLAIFGEGTMGLAARRLVPWEERFTFEDADNVLFCNFEGLSLHTPGQVEELKKHLDAKFHSAGRPVHVIVNYDNFEVLGPARTSFFEMIRENQDHVLSRVRYSTNAFFRRQMGHQFAAASLENGMYPSFAAARADLPRYSG